MAEGTSASLKESFKRSFENGPKLSISATRDLTDYMSSIKSVLSNPNEDWQNRVKHLKMLRGVVHAGGANHPDFSEWLRHLTHPVQMTLNDLRSVVTREACITVAHLSKQLKMQFSHFAEVVFPNLVALIGNSVKVISSCGLVTIDFLLQHTQSPRFIPIMTGSLTSKSNVTRRHLHAFLLQVTREWPVALQQKHVTLLRDALVAGLHDADKDARQHARKSFKNFCNAFPHEARLVLSNLDSSIRHGIEQEFRESQKMRQSMESKSSSSESVASKSSLRRGSASSIGRQNTSSQKSSAPPERPKALQAGGSGVPRRRDMSLRVSQSQRSFTTTPAKKKIVDGQSFAQSSHVPAQVRVVKGREQISRASVQKSAASGQISRASVQKSADGGREPRQSESQLRGNSGRTSKSSSRDVSPSRRDFASYRPPGSSGPSTVKAQSKIPRIGGGPEPPKLSLGRRNSDTDSNQSIDGDLETNYSVNSNGSTPVSGPPFPESRPPMPNQTRTHEWARTWTVFDSDDSMSETSSSLGSESSYSSHGILSFANEQDSRTFQAMNKSIQEITIKLRSAQWTNRRDSLIQFRRLLINGLPLDQQEVKHMKRMFTRVFEDPSDAVVAAFLEALQIFVQVYHEDLYAWLPSLLAGLMTKHSQANQAVMQTRIYETLHVIRNSFPPDLQWRAVCKLLVESSQAPTIKVKLCLLSNLNELIPCLSQHVLLNVTGSIRMAVSKIVSWTLEPRSMEVRRLSSLVLLMLCDVNDELFGALINSLPRTFQEGAAKVLQNAERLRPPIEADETAAADNQEEARSATQSASAAPWTITVQPPTPSTAPSSTMATSQPPPPPASDRTSTDSGIQSSNPDLNGVNSQLRGAPPVSRQSSAVNHGIATMDENNLSKLKDTDVDDDSGGFEAFSDDDMSRILQELSNHNERHRERRACLVELSDILQSVQPHILTQKWDDYFKPTLLLLLETLGDNRSALRAGALRTLKDLVRADSKDVNIKIYGELTLLRVLEAHGDMKKRVMRAAEECAYAITDILPSELCINVLVPVISNSLWRIMQAAIRLEMRLMKSCTNCESFLPIITPGLVKACEDSESRIRKSAVFCLVVIYLRVGEQLWPYISQLSVGKIRLIKVYIQRARENESSALTTARPLSYSEP